MTKKFNQYLGKAGQLAVMSELLMRGWNVAIPEVDVGDDIFVVKDDDGTLRRVQVKTSMATKRKHGFSVQFLIRRRQIQAEIDMYFVLIARFENRWSDLVIIASGKLREHVDSYKKVSASGGDINLYLSYTKDQVICSKVDFTGYRNDFSYFPFIEH